MKKSLPIILALFFTSISIGFSQGYFVVTPPNSYYENNLYTIDPLDATTSSTIPVDFNGISFDGFSGLAYNPADNELYGIIKSGPTFSLVIVDPTTGVATEVGVLSDKFAGITFAPDGTLYGVTGDGGNLPSAIYSISSTDATSTLLIDVTGGSDGEAIAFNSNDGLIYRYGGDDFWQTINPSTLETVDGAITGESVSNYAHCLYYRADTDDFLFSEGQEFNTLSTAGAMVQLSVNLNNFGFKGIVAESAITAVKEKYQASSHIQLFPNPALDAVNIQFEELVKELTVKVYQANGQLVRTIETGGVNQVAIDLNGLPGGLYNIAIHEDGKHFIKRFVKK